MQSTVASTASPPGVAIPRAIPNNRTARSVDFQSAQECRIYHQEADDYAG